MSAMTEPTERDREMAFRLASGVVSVLLGAGEHVHGVDPIASAIVHGVDAIASAIAAARMEERERCAKIADDMTDDPDNGDANAPYVSGVISERIRSGE